MTTQLSLETSALPAKHEGVGNDPTSTDDCEESPSVDVWSTVVPRDCYPGTGVDGSTISWCSAETDRLTCHHNVDGLLGETRGNGVWRPVSPVEYSGTGGEIKHPDVMDGTYIVCTCCVKNWMGETESGTTNALETCSGKGRRPSNMGAFYHAEPMEESDGADAKGSGWTTCYDMVCPL